ncbi:MAG: pilus assembly protein PilC [Alphaproteobacteria bacterium CG11_big_fil_rev_8_21_14_0_20_39_49]|nr:MAG: pilus assembly protein PilC [Alphaproteobacteria bacterium CG11_big_fil_rev_8_21_14_0_20_39_49]
MAIFQWKGIQGSEVANGEIEARNSDEATKKLKNQKIIVTNIVLISGQEIPTPTEGEAEKKVSTKQGLKPKKYKAKGIKVKDKVIFTKKFSTMVSAGLPILKTLQMLESQQENPNFKWVVRAITEDVESGSTLSEAFAEHPAIFDTVYVNLVKAGEMSGKLTTFLQRLVIQLEKAEHIRKRLKGALSYPIILLCVAFAVITLMLIKVVPVFQNMFGQMGHDLPGPTQLIVDISEFIRDPAKGGTILVIMIATFISVKWLKKNNMAFKKKWDKLVLKIPIIGNCIQKSTLAKIAMIEGNLAAAGVSVIESLDIIEQTMTNTVFIEAFDVIKDGVSSGNSLSSLYSMCPIFPPTFYQMLAVGEETGNMEDMFDATTAFYEEEFDMAVDRLTEALEPIMIVSMGITVGFIIVAMYMPIFQMGAMVGG